jgi:hypothetical protein
LAIGPARAKQMRALVLTAVAAALLVPAGGARAAAAKQPPPAGLSPFFTTGWSETTYDASGKVVAVASGTGDRAAAGVDKPAAGAAIAPDDLSGSAPEAVADAYSGCKSVHAYVTRYTLLGFVAYRWNHDVYFCWSYPHITQFAANEYVSDNDGNNYVRTVYRYGYWYTWSGASNGGHYSWREAQVDNCILRYGCIGTSYPWVEIWINGNGAWASNGGGV